MIRYKTLLALFALLASSTAPALFAGEGRCQQVVQQGDKTIMIGPIFGSSSYLGVELTSLTPELRRHFGAPEDLGVMVSRVEDDSPAFDAGLRVGDILTHVDAEAVASAGQLARTVRGHDAGDSVQIEYLREGSSQTTSAVLAERERCAVDISPMIGDFQVQGLEEGLQALEAIDWSEIGVISSEAVEHAMESARYAIEGQDWEVMAEKWEAWAEESAAEWEAWGEKFGEEFGEKFSEKFNEDYMEKLELRMEELERQMEDLEVEIEESFDFDVDVDTDGDGKMNI